MDRVVREEDRRTRVENACCFSFLIRIRSVSRKQRRVETINVCVCVCVCVLGEASSFFLETNEIGLGSQLIGSLPRSQPKPRNDAIGLASARKKSGRRMWVFLLSAKISDVDPI